MGEENKRVYDRVNINLPIKIGDNNKFDSFSEDLSLSGGLIYSPHALQIGDKISFDIKQDNRNLHLEAEIVRLAPVKKTIGEFHKDFTKKHILSLFLEEDKKEIFFHGVLNEISDFDSIDLAGYEEITLNFEGLLNANSSGLLLLVSFLENLGVKKIKFRMVPEFIIEQMLVIPELLPLHAEVESISETYECSNCHLKKNLVFDLNVFIDNPDEKIPDKVVCTCGEHLEGDIIPFLNYDQIHFLVGSTLSRTLPNILPLFESLEDAKEHFDNIFPHVEEKLILLDEKGNLLSMNLTGLEFFDDTDFLLHIKNGQPDFYKKLEELVNKKGFSLDLNGEVQQGQKITFVNHSKKLDFDYHFLPLSTMITDQEKKVLGYLLTINDNSRIRELEKKLKGSGEKIFGKKNLTTTYQTWKPKDVFCIDCFFVGKIITQIESDLKCPKCKSSDIFNSLLKGYGIRFINLGIIQVKELKEIIEEEIELKSKDRRTGLRLFPKEINLNFKSGNEIYKSYVKDISRGGIFIYSPEDLTIGQEILINLNVDGKPDSLEILAKVVRRDQETDKKRDNHRGYGLKFLNYQESVRLEVETFINKMSNYKLLKLHEREKVFDKLIKFSHNFAYVFIGLIVFSFGYFLIEFTNFFPDIKKDIYNIKGKILKKTKKADLTSLFKEEVKNKSKKTSSVKVNKKEEVKFKVDYNNNINSSKEAELNERFHNDSDHYKGELKKFGLDGNYYYKILKDLNPRERNLLNAIATTDQGYKKVAHRKTEEWLLNTPLPSDQEAYKVASEYDEWINDERYISEDKTNLVMTENGPQMIKEKNPDYTKKMDEKKMRGWEVKAFHETAMLEMNIDSLNKSILKSNKKEGPANNPNAEKLKQNTEKLKKWRELKVARLKALKKRISNEQN